MNQFITAESFIPELQSKQELNNELTKSSSVRKLTFVVNSDHADSSWMDVISSAYDRRNWFRIVETDRPDNVIKFLGSKEISPKTDCFLLSPKLEVLWSNEGGIDDAAYRKLRNTVDLFELGWI